jgi:hypothetical protein
MSDDLVIAHFFISEIEFPPVFTENAEGFWYGFSITIRG